MSCLRRHKVSYVPQLIHCCGRYNLSKLIQLYTLIKLAMLIDPLDDKSDPHPIVINSVDPCFCETGLSREVTGLARLAVKTFAAIAARPPDDGARQIVHAASCGRETHGLYLRAGAVEAYKPIAQDKSKTEYLWDVLQSRLQSLVRTVPLLTFESQHAEIEEPAKMKFHHRIRPSWKT